MTLPTLSIILITIWASVTFGIIATLLYLRGERTRKLLIEQDKQQKERLFQISVLKEIQDKISYSLDIYKILDVLATSLSNIISYSSLSAILIQPDHLVFKTHLQEKVSKNYLEKIQHTMVEYLQTLSKLPLPSRIESLFTGVIRDDTEHKSPESLFHVPIIINDQRIGLLTISSSKPNLYSQREIDLINQIAEHSFLALGRLERVLQAEKGKLMSLIGSLTDGIFMISTTNKLLFINEAAKRLLGIVKPTITFEDILHVLLGKYDLPAKIALAISENKSINDNEIELGGKTLTVSITPVIYTSKDEATLGIAHIIGTSVLLHDITSEKKLEKVKENFTHVVLHELRAPLSAIKSAAELMLASRDKLTIEEQNKLFTIIDDQSKRMLSETATILDAAKLEAGKLSIQKVPTDIKKVIKERIGLFLAQAQSKQVELLATIPEPLPTILCDPIRIGEALDNLISNSLKFTPSHGKIEVLAKQHFYTSEKGSSHNSIDVSVADTGTGIPKEKQADLFKKFSQVHAQGPQTSQAGTGLGLYIIKGIIDAHGGTIVVDSEPGKGTTITFSIPV